MRVFTLSIMYSLLVLSMLYGEVTIGADVVSRYVWRGTDYGNAAAVQPGIETAVGPITVGAWGSWSISPGLYFDGTQNDEGDDNMVTEASGNECDLYASTTVGPVGLTVTDYFFPAYAGTDSLLNVDKHTIELSAGADVGPVSVLAAANVSGDDDNSTYLELTYGAFSLGLGNGAYSTDGEFAPVSIGVSASRDNFSASYIINPNQETSFLVFGVNF
ncbi:MAG: hypothetical protein QF380_01125 [Candidatus Marinimicrobia bacterium]|jgi:hypothetical protein|nr:hypothetical protein [Candidatus Neomarinimicrobiota bacterium]